MKCVCCDGAGKIDGRECPECFGAGTFESPLGTSPMKEMVRARAMAWVDRLLARNQLPVVMIGMRQTRGATHLETFVADGLKGGGFKELVKALYQEVVLGDAVEQAGRIEDLPAKTTEAKE
jgi:hypothetical protein